MIEKLLGLPAAASEHAHRLDAALGWVHVVKTFFNAFAAPGFPDELEITVYHVPS